VRSYAYTDAWNTNTNADAWNTNTDANAYNTDAYTYGDANSYTQSDTEAAANTLSSADTAIRHSVTRSRNLKKVTK
jgi:hypothetical protein